jgi:putative oxidoreductase
MLDRINPTDTTYNSVGPLGSGLVDPLLLIARILAGYIFLLSGWGKILGLAGFATYLQRHGLPASYPLAVLGAGVEFLGGLALILGIVTRFAALALIAFILVATGIAHRFWELDGAARGGQATNFNKNMAMIGGLLALLVAGPGRFSIDRLVAARKTRSTGRNLRPWWSGSHARLP